VVVVVVVVEGELVCRTILVKFSIIWSERKGAM
jgi:hypothetical protein